MPYQGIHCLKIILFNNLGPSRTVTMRLNVCTIKQTSLFKTLAFHRQFKTYTIKSPLPNLTLRKTQLILIKNHLPLKLVVSQK